ncbi:MAG TPA: gliding motility-associated C-terminal domain-containing protein, partial [Adhaeribacter sp.]|nr:gliding motility-associated C-terminal domain-containing protein [Adhaeribacter sp.]
AGYQPVALTQTTWFRRTVYSAPCQQLVSTAVKVTVTLAIADNTITSQPQSICSGAVPAQLSGSQPTGGNGTYAYAWQYSTTGPNSGFVTAGGSFQQKDYVPAALYQTTWFRRAVTSGNCTQYSPAVKVEIVPPIANNLISATQTIYAGSAPAVLTGTAPTGGSGNFTFEWEMSTTGNSSGFTTAGTGNNFHPAATWQTTWFRRIARSGDCNLTSNVVEITVVPAVSNNVIKESQTICINNVPDVLTGTTPVGGTGQYSYLWESSTISASSGFVTAAGAASSASYSPAAISQTTWFRRQVISGSYTQTSNVVAITVNPNIANNTISGAQTICAGETPAGLSASVPTGGSGSFSYLWEASTTGPATGFITAPGLNQKETYQPGELLQTTWFRRVVSAGHCSDNISNAVAITVNVIPSPPAIPSVTICANESATLVLPVNRPVGDNSLTEFEWYATAHGGQLLAKGTSYQTEALKANRTYYVQTLTNGCVSQRTAVEVYVREATADAGEDLNIITGRSAYLHAKGGVSYKWSPAESLDDPNIARPTAKPLKTTTYTVEVVSENGCISYDEVTVTVLPKISIPNTFTPNRDGINDTWEIKGLHEYAGCRVEIFNRWGQKVYSTLGYPQAWNGVAQTGEELPVATYY